MKHVGLYCRESVDRSGKAENVADQEKWGREYAASKWPRVPVLVFTDNDTSAVGKPRPGYEALRAAIARGEVAHLWAVEQSRFERDELSWFTIAAELVAAGIGELHTRRDGVIPVRGVVAGIKAVVAAEERRRMIERVNDRLDVVAADGQPPGVRPFGYVHARTADGVRTYAIVPGQADAIRHAAQRVLSGWSLTSVAAELDRRGLRGAHGGKVTGDRVRGWLTAPSIAGHRVHRGRDLGPGSGNWPPILDESTFDAVRDRLNAGRTVTRADGGTYPVGSAHTGYSGRKYVLTGGLAVCGVCDAPMVGTVKQLKGGAKRGGRDVAYYVCHPSRGGRACTGIMLEATEEYVADRLFLELDKPEFLARVAADEHAPRREELATALRAVDAKRRELAAMWGRDELTTPEWEGARHAADVRERALRGELAALPPPPPQVDAAGAREAWPFMTLDERRELLRLFIERVVIKRAVPGRKGFDDGRVDVEFIER